MGLQLLIQVLFNLQTYLSYFQYLIHIVKNLYYFINADILYTVCSVNILKKSFPSVTHISQDNSDIIVDIHPCYMYWSLAGLCAFF
jgi:hypothetical protein